MIKRTTILFLILCLCVQLNSSRVFAESLYVKSTGVGIGLDTPSRSLDVNGNALVRSSLKIDTSSGAHVIELKDRSIEFTTALDAKIKQLASGKNIWIEYPNGYVKFDGSNGNVYVEDSVYSKEGLLTSDINAKTDITALDSALDKLLLLDGFSFKWKDSGRRSIGVAAQQVKEVFPELVGYDAEKGLMAVNYAGLIPVLIEALRTQENTIASLETRLSRLEGLAK